MKNRKYEPWEEFMKGGMKGFIHKGTNGRWKDVLTDKDIEQYRTLASYYMNDKQINYLETGQWN